MNDDDITSEIDSFRTLLATPLRKRRLTPALRQEFRRYMQTQRLELTREGLWMISVFAPLAYAGLYISVQLIAPPEQQARCIQVLNLAFLGELIFASMIVFMHRLPKASSLYSVYFIISWTGLIAVACIATAALPGPYMDMLAGYVTSVIILVAFALGVFDIRLSMLAAGTGLLVALGMSRQLELAFDIGAFFGYAILPTVVGVVVAHLMEMRDCTSFLQSKLLAAEKIVLDRYATQVERLSRTDALTGLANRRFFNEVLEREWSRSRRSGTPVALIFIDVDHFKLYNDTYGHQAGDAVLASIGTALAECARRPADLPARYGGEEFVVLLPGTEQEGALDVAGQIVSAISALGIRHESSTVSDRITASIGVAAMTADASSSSRTLVAVADAAAYAAKEGGRNRIVAGVNPVDAPAMQ